MTAFQRQVELRVIHRLHFRVHKDLGGTTREQIKKWVCDKSNVSHERFDEAFDSLRRLGYLAEMDLNENSDVLYKLSSFGLEWVEDYYNFQEVDGGLTYSRKHDGTVVIGTRRAKYLESLASKDDGGGKKLETSEAGSWTKSGAIAAWIAIPVAIAGVIITILLGWK